MNKFKPFSQREILATSRLYESSTEGLQIVTEANLAYARSRGYIFLSHSNKDKALALAFVRYMELHGVKAYIDLYDSVLPLPPSAYLALISSGTRSSPLLKSTNTLSMST